MSDFKELLQAYDDAIECGVSSVMAKSMAGTDDIGPEERTTAAARAALVKCYDELEDTKVRLQRTIRQYDQTIRNHQEHIANLEQEQDDKTKTDS